MTQRNRRGRGEWFEPEDSVGQPLAEDCPKCLRRWSTTGGFGRVDPQLPADEVNLGDFLTADGRDLLVGDPDDTSEALGMVQGLPRRRAHGDEGEPPCHASTPSVLRPCHFGQPFTPPKPDSRLMASTDRRCLS